MNAGEILTEAAKIVEGSRQQTHGDKERSFAAIAAIWSAYLQHAGVTGEGVEINPEDVANMMALLKMARAMQGDKTHTDHYVDGAAYFALAGELSTTTTE